MDVSRSDSDLVEWVKGDFSETSDGGYSWREIYWVGCRTRIFWRWSGWSPRALPTQTRMRRGRKRDIRAHRGVAG